MKGKEIKVPVVFVDSHVNHPEFGRFYDDEEKVIFNQEMAKLTRFLVDANVILPFADANKPHIQK